MLLRRCMRGSLPCRSCTSARHTIPSASSSPSSTLVYCHQRHHHQRAQLSLTTSTWPSSTKAAGAQLIGAAMATHSSAGRAWLQGKDDHGAYIDPHFTLEPDDLSGPLAGRTAAIKDLFDVEGHR